MMMMMMMVMMMRVMIMMGAVQGSRATRRADSGCTEQLGSGDDDNDDNDDNDDVFRFCVV